MAIGDCFYGALGSNTIQTKCCNNQKKPNTHTKYIPRDSIYINVVKLVLSMVGLIMSSLVNRTLLMSFLLFQVLNRKKRLNPALASFQLPDLC